MPGTDESPFGPDFDGRLRGELDAVEPLRSSPRYVHVGRRPAGLRLAPALLAIAFLGILGLSVFAATGSQGPGGWTQRVITIINAGHSSPRPSASPTGHATPAGQPTATPQSRETPEPSEKPEPGESPEPRESPDASGDDDHSGRGDSSSSSGEGSGDGSSPAPAADD